MRVAPTLLAAVLALTLGAPASPALAAAPYQVAFLFGSGDMNEAEKELKEGHAQDAADTLLAVYEGKRDSLTAEEKARLLKLRADIARGGGYIGHFKDWDYDGLKLGSALKYVEVIEQKGASMEGAIKMSQSQRLEELVDEVRAIFARPEFASNPALVHYRDHFAEPSLARHVHTLSGYRARDFKNYYVMAFRAIAKGDYESTRVDVESARKLYTQLRAAAYDTAGHMLKGNPDDELSDEISIEQAVKRLDEMMAKSGKLAAKAKADQAAKVAAWKKALKADKLKIYGAQGEPHNWPGGWGLEDVVKASYWSYYERASDHYRWMTTYYFDAQQKLVKQDRRLIFSP